jgi:AhpD family alkylhydroperoxidase
MVDICFDAQTSGGLLIAIEQAKAADLLKALRDRGVSASTVIGKITGKGAGLIHVETTGKRTVPSLASAKAIESPQSSITNHPSSMPPVSCCADAVASAPASAQGSSEVGSIKAAFTQFLSAANSPHGLDAYTKQAMAIALSVALRCEPCLKMHLNNARKKGFSEGEIDEAAWMGISFAGSPAMVFYEQIKNRQ